MILSWGKCKIEKTSSPASDSSVWDELDTPKEGTTKLTATAGQEKTAIAEGGEIVDVKYNRNTYLLEFDLFVKKGSTAPFTDDDGVVSGEFTFRVSPVDDPSCPGILIDRASVRVDESYSSEDGILLHHACQCLRPASGNTIKAYTAGTGGGSSE